MLVASQPELSVPRGQQRLCDEAGLHAVVLYPLLCLRGSLNSHGAAGGGSAFLAPAATVRQHRPAELPRSQHRTTHTLAEHARSKRPLLLQQPTGTGGLVTADPF